MIHTALIVGQPNSGKTALFNALTGAESLTGNWAGVTVDIATAAIPNTAFIVKDLPGIYGLLDEPTGEDEKLAYHTIIHTPDATIVHVINACQIKQSLCLTSELAELGQPMIIAISMTDVAQKDGITVDVSLLAQTFNCPVICIDYQKPETLARLKTTLGEPLSPPTPLSLKLPRPLLEKLNQDGVTTLFQQYQKLLPDAGMQLLQARRQAIQKLALPTTTILPSALDKILLHRVLGLPLFLSIIYALFFLTVHGGGLFQPFFDLAGEALFVQGSTVLFKTLHFPDWLIMLLSDGVGKGINTTLTFIPTLFTLYFSLAFLEGSGYMARAAFVMDKCMRLLKLPGQAFIPFILGFGCNVPAILATRNLANKRDRLLTILMIPFMSCSARLTIYTVFVSLFFPDNGQNIIFLLYLLGITIAVLTGFILQKTQLSQPLSPLILELPSYQIPAFKRLLSITIFRLKQFLKRAFMFILPTCLILSMLNVLPSPTSHAETFLAYFASLLTPLFEPMGITAENWPATVGLLTGVLAKEVVIGSLNTLYQQIDTMSALYNTSVFTTLSAAFTSIPEQFHHLIQAVLHPLEASVKEKSFSRALQPIISQYFTSHASIYAYLTFILLYMPCVSTMAAIKQEASKTWMGFSVLWSFFLAYMLAVDVYQIATFSEHPVSTLLWVTGLGLAFFALYQGLKKYPQSLDNLTTTPHCATFCIQCTSKAKT